MQGKRAQEKTQLSSGRVGQICAKAFGLGGILFLIVSLCSCAPSSSQHANEKLSADQRADQLLSRMTLDEKIQLVHGDVQTSVPRGAGSHVPGIPRLGIPDLYFADGSVGVGNNVGQATALPSSIASAATWDLQQAYNYGKVIGKELSDYGINLNLGGNVNLTSREPRDSRTFETKGEDPILAGKVTAAQLTAIQDEHVIACIKHFAFNDQETFRVLANAIIDERSARESDLLAFEIGIKDSNVQSVMCAFNLYNGIHSCENDFLLNRVLKNDWAFPGFVMTDFRANDFHQITQSPALAGLDMEIPVAILFGDQLKQSVLNGQFPMSRLDEMVHRVLRAMFAVGIFDQPQGLKALDVTGDGMIAEQVEEQGAVLLKNAGNQLPLAGSKIASLAVIGSHANVGVLSGGGSAQVIPIGGAAAVAVAPTPTQCLGTETWDPSSPLNAIQAKAPGARIRYDEGTNSGSAAALASISDVAIVFVNQWETENCDLPDLNLRDNQDQLVTAVASANPHTIVILETGGAQLMPWLDSVSAVLEAWYPGQQGGTAIANVLFGNVNPSGKLPITFPRTASDLPRPTIPAPVGSGLSIFNVDYIEGFNVGYKWFDANRIEPLFPFGYGLSYTTFSFNNLTIADAGKLSMSFEVTNTGSLAGAEVAQVYLGLPPSSGEPAKRLVAWDKVYLQPDETRGITLILDTDSAAHPLSIWDVATETWRVEKGNYTVYIGDSARDIHLTGAFVR
jgi:beta-glucosidase